MNPYVISDPDQAKIDARECLKIIQDAREKCGESEFLNELERKMEKLVESVDKL